MSTTAATQKKKTAAANQHRKVNAMALSNSKHFMDNTHFFTTSDGFIYLSLALLSWRLLCARECMLFVVHISRHLYNFAALIMYTCFQRDEQRIMFQYHIGHFNGFPLKPSLCNAHTHTSTDNRCHRKSLWGNNSDGDSLNLATKFQIFLSLGC